MRPLLRQFLDILILQNIKRQPNLKAPVHFSEIPCTISTYLRCKYTLRRHSNGPSLLTNVYIASDDQLVMTCLDLMVGGVETSSTTLGWIGKGTSKRKLQFSADIFNQGAGRLKLFNTQSTEY